MMEGVCERPNVNTVVLDGQSGKQDKIILSAMKNKLKMTQSL